MMIYVLIKAMVLSASPWSWQDNKSKAGERFSLPLQAIVFILSLSKDSSTQHPYLYDRPCYGVMASLFLYRYAVAPMLCTFALLP